MNYRNLSELLERDDKARSLFDTLSPAAQSALAANGESIASIDDLRRYYALFRSGERLV